MLPPGGARIRWLAGRLSSAARAEARGPRRAATGTRGGASSLPPRAAAAVPPAPLASSMASPHVRYPAHPEALVFEVEGRWGRARAGRLRMPHGTVETPVFMPVGTQGAVKGLTAENLEALGADIILGNTYHLGLRPGEDLLRELGGLHAFAGWRRNLLTDSGGFQMVSLLHLADITEEGVTFQSPVDGSPMLLTPERSIQIQNAIGADIIMQLDDVVPSTVVDPTRFEEACHRTTRWLDRCIAAHAHPERQNLFPIVQGGLDPRLRDISLAGLVARECPGYAVGGLAGGEDKDSFISVVAQCSAGLPEGKPRYLMGVGYPLDMVLCSALGMDMYDCVYPTRTARFGTALVPPRVAPGGILRVRQAQYKDDMGPLDPECDCIVCRGDGGEGYSRAFLHYAMSGNGGGQEPMGGQLISYHNIAYQMRLMREMRGAILRGGDAFPTFVMQFVLDSFDGRPSAVPSWVRTALVHAGIHFE